MLPCCTLLGVLLGQLGLGTAAAKGRIFGAFAARAGGYLWLGMAVAISIELVLAAATLPFVVSEARAGIVHICSVAVALSGHT